MPHSTPFHRLAQSIGQRARRHVLAPLFPRRFASAIWPDDLPSAEPELEQRIEFARRAGKSYAMRVVAVPRTLGVLVAVGAVVLLFGYRPASLEAQAGRCLGTLSLPMLLLSIPPTDAWVGIVVSFALSVLMIVLGYVNLSGALRTIRRDHSDSCPALGMVRFFVHSSLFSGVQLILVGLVLLHRILARAGARVRWIIKPITSRALLDSMWIVFTLTFLTNFATALLTVLVAGGVIPHFTATYRFSESLFNALLAAFCGAFCASPSARARTHAWLASRGGGVSAAAGVSALIGLTGDAKSTIAEGKRRLRSISCELLTEDVFAQTSTQFWSLLSSPAELDAIDAFVSHSWSDNAAHKWHALQGWRQRFVEAHGREPKLWLDRCCISNVGKDLPHLPIFLAGCRKLVILAGETYLGRLWCIVELFVFEQMELCAKDDFLALIELQMLPGFERAHIEHFDVSRCVCSVPADVECLLSCIQLTCGSVDGFNRRARQLLKRAPHVRCSEPSAVDGALPALFQLQPQAAEQARPLSEANSSVQPAPSRRLGDSVVDFCAEEDVRVVTQGTTPAVAVAVARPVHAPRASHASRHPSGLWPVSCQDVSLLLALCAVLVYVSLGAALSAQLSAAPLGACYRCERLLGHYTIGTDGWLSPAAELVASGGAHARSWRLSSRRGHAVPPLPHNQSQTACAAEGGQLARIADAGEQTLLHCLMGEIGWGSWIAQRPWPQTRGLYNGWDPLDSGPIAPRDCVTLSTYGWTVAPCTNAMAFFCQRPLSVSLERNLPQTTAHVVKSGAADLD